MKWWAVAIAVCVGAAATATLLVGTAPPPVMPSNADGLAAPPSVTAILRRSCYDCHSDETRWPWYSRIPPVSLLIEHDVRRGRKELNLSLWGTYYPLTRRHKLQWMGRALRNGSMPPWTYRVIHREARLSPADHAQLEQWIAAELAKSS
jgi:hypothetical protein